MNRYITGGYILKKKLAFLYAVLFIFFAILFIMKKNTDENNKELNDEVDIISDNKEGGVSTYIYLPKATGDRILKNEGSFDDVEDDIFIMWVPRNVSEYNVSYWNATDFKVYFPLHQIYQSNCKIEYIVGHYNNYRDIKNAKELKDALKKYN